MNTYSFIENYINYENYEIWILPSGVDGIELYGNLWVRYSLFSFSGSYFNKEDGLSRDYLKHKLEVDKKSFNENNLGRYVDYSLNSIFSSEVSKVVPLSEKRIGIIIKSIEVSI